MGMLFTNLQETNKDFAFEFFVTDKQQKDWGGTDTPFFTGKNIVYLARDVYHNFLDVQQSETSVVGDAYGSSGVILSIGPGLKMFVKYAQVEYNPNTSPPVGGFGPGTRVVKVLGMVPGTTSPAAVLYRAVNVEIKNAPTALSSNATVTPAIADSGQDLIVTFSVADYSKWNPNPSVTYRAIVSSMFIYIG